jgi:hypothetical protein
MNFGACQAGDEPTDENLLWDPAIMGAGTSGVCGGVGRSVTPPQNDKKGVQIAERGR